MADLVFRRLDGRTPAQHLPSGGLVSAVRVKAEGTIALSIEAAKDGDGQDVRSMPLAPIGNCALAKDRAFDFEFTASVDEVASLKHGVREVGAVVENDLFVLNVSVRALRHSRSPIAVRTTMVAEAGRATSAAGGGLAA